MNEASRTHTVSKPNGVFLFLLDYEAEDDLGKVLALVEKRLAVSFSSARAGPYSSHASAEYKGHVLIAAADSDGCYLRFEPGQQCAANEVADLL
jgi:hypothetical protein